MVLKCASENVVAIRKKCDNEKVLRKWQLPISEAFLVRGSRANKVGGGRCTFWKGNREKMAAAVKSLHRYAVKGMAPDSMQKVALGSGDYFFPNE